MSVIEYFARPVTVPVSLKQCYSI